MDKMYVIEKFRAMNSIIEAMRFVTNNEPDDKNMNTIVGWINQGRDSLGDLHAWHNGTDIFIHTSEGILTGHCGDWIIRKIKQPFTTDSTTFYPCEWEIFEKMYEPN